MTFSRNRAKLICLFVALIGGAVLTQRYLIKGTAESAKATKQLPLVSATTSQLRDLPVKFSAEGHLVALNQVDVRPQATGVIKSVNFHEGDQVKAGQLLFTLDDTDANAQLRRAQAQAAQIQSQLSDAQRDYERSKQLLKKEFISAGAVETVGSKVDALKAQLAASFADVDSARALLDHTRITSPISAQAGALSVHPGSLAQQSATAPLVSLAVFDPIGVEFSLPEHNLNQLLSARADAPVAVTLETPDGKTLAGKLIFINNTVNTDTGTINVKASFLNPNKTLWPGAFSRVTVEAGLDKNAVVLPPQALLEGPNGRFVYQLDSDNKVTAKPVTLLRIQDRMAVVTGLGGGEKIVLEGNQNLRSGATVRVSEKSDLSSPVAPVTSSETP